VEILNQDGSGTHNCVAKHCWWLKPTVANSPLKKGGGGCSAEG